MTHDVHEEGLVFYRVSPSSWSSRHSWWVSSHWHLTTSSVSAAAAGAQRGVCCPPSGFDTPPSAHGTPPSTGLHHLMEQEDQRWRSLYVEYIKRDLALVYKICLVQHLQERTQKWVMWAVSPQSQAQLQSPGMTSWVWGVCLSPLWFHIPGILNGITHTDMTPLALLLNPANDLCWLAHANMTWAWNIHNSMLCFYDQPARLMMAYLCKLCKFIYKFKIPCWKITLVKVTDTNTSDVNVSEFNIC